MGEDGELEGEGMLEAIISTRGEKASGAAEVAEREKGLGGSAVPGGEKGLGGDTTVVGENGLGGDKDEGGLPGGYKGPLCRYDAVVWDLGRGEGGERGLSAPLEERREPLRRSGEAAADAEDEDRDGEEVGDEDEGVAEGGVSSCLGSSSCSVLNCFPKLISISMLFESLRPLPLSSMKSSILFSKVFTLAQTTSSSS